MKAALAAAALLLYAGAAQAEDDHPSTNLEAAWQACLQNTGVELQDSNGKITYEWNQVIANQCNKLQMMHDAAIQKNREKDDEWRAKSYIPIINRGLKDPDGKPPK